MSTEQQEYDTRILVNGEIIVIDDLSDIDFFQFMMSLSYKSVAVWSYKCNMSFISADTPTVNHRRREVASHQVESLFYQSTSNITGTRLHSSQREERRQIDKQLR